jgi:hypothetical protein
MTCPSALWRPGTARPSVGVELDVVSAGVGSISVAAGAGSRVLGPGADGAGSLSAGFPADSLLLGSGVEELLLEAAGSLGRGTAGGALAASDGTALGRRAGGPAGGAGVPADSREGARVPLPTPVVGEPPALREPLVAVVLPVIVDAVVCADHVAAEPLPALGVASAASTGVLNHSDRLGAGVCAFA